MKLTEKEAVIKHQVACTNNLAMPSTSLKPEKFKIEKNYVF